MSTQAAIRALVGEYSGLCRTGAVTATGTTETLTDLLRLGSYATDVPEGSVLVLKFTDAATSFYDGGANNDEIRDSGNGFASYCVGDKVTVSGTASNDGIYTILSVAAGALGVATGSLTTETVAAVLTTYEQSWVTDYDKTTGTITFAPARNVPAVGQTYELWDKVAESVTRVNDAIDRALTQRCWCLQLVPLGMLADGDCQAVTGWTASAGTKAVAALAYPYRLAPRYYIAFTTVAGNDYLYNSVAVAEGRTWQLAIMLRVAAATTATVSVYDVTNSAAITTSGDTLSVTGLSSAGSPWVFLRASFAVPDDCDSIQVRIANGTATGVTHLAMVALWPQDTYTLPIPDRIVSERHVRRIFRNTEKLDIDFPQTWAQQEHYNVWPERNSAGGLTMRWGRTLGSNGPWVFEERGFYEELSADTSTTDCDEDYLAYLAVDELLADITRQQLIASGPEEAQRYEALRKHVAASGSPVVADRGPQALGVVVRRG